MNLLKKIILAKKVPTLIKNKSFVIVGGNGGTGGGVWRECEGGTGRSQTWGGEGCKALKQS